MPGEQVGAQALELQQGELCAHGFLDGYDVNVFVTHVLNELMVAALLAEAADVPNKGPHQGSIGGLLDPKTREALSA